MREPQACSPSRIPWARCSGAWFAGFLLLPILGIEASFYALAVVYGAVALATAQGRSPLRGRAQGL
jgi:hypothetical protein